MPDPFLSKAPDRIAGMFDAIAGRYDFLNHFLSAGLDRRWRQRAVQSLRLTGRERVLDLCTGTGDFAIAAVRARPAAARVIGVDFAGEMLRIGRAKLQQGTLGDRIALVRGDAMRVPCRDRTFDAITIAFGIRNVQDPLAACREMVRVLKPGGRLALLEFTLPSTPVISTLYLWYLRHLLPRIGRAISRHEGAYGYLPASIDAFASPEEFMTILRQAGFVDLAAARMTFGSVCLYTATRQGVASRE